MKRRASINPNSIKAVSYAVTALFLILINLLCTKMLLQQSNKLSVQQFTDSCEKITDGYTETIEVTIQNYKTALRIIDFPNLYRSMSASEIHSFIQEHYEKVSDAFETVFFVDTNGEAYCSNGKTVNVKKRDYFNAIMNRNIDDYVSNEVRSLINYASVFVLAKAVYDEKGNKKGILCGSVKLSTISDIINDISIHKEGAIIVQDYKSEFIAHPEHNWQGQVFNPSYLNLSLTRNDSDSDVNRIETTSTQGNPIFVFHKPVTGTPWSVGYCIPISTFSNLRQTQFRYQIIVIIISFIATAFIIFLELFATHLLQKRQMVAINFDPLTHLPTRERFEREANKLLLHNRNSKFMLIEADIRGFKFINQNHGELRADMMLIQFSKMMNEIIQRQKGLICRSYADHFYAILKIPSIQKAMKTFNDYADHVNESIKKSDIPYIPKFGISFYLPKDDGNIVSVQHLIGQATFAKNSIKDDALKQYAIFDTKLSEKTNEENYIELHMEQALKNEEFFVVYQPKINLKTEKIAGSEALVRWNNPKLGFMAPYKFIPLFEKNNFIVKLDFEVYRQVFKFIRKCLDENIPVVPVSINMSRNHDNPEKFVKQLIELMNSYNVPPEYVEVELLERSSMDKNTLREVTLLLHQKGLTVAMDDFGSGESSLNMLSNIPVDILKFDRSFLLGADMKNSEITDEKAAFIETLVNLGKNLKKHTIFEGVETEEQRDFLKSIQCDTVQGYFYSKPLSEAEYIDFVKNHI